MALPGPIRHRHASRKEILAAVEAVLSAQPLVTAVEYLSVGCPATMEELEEVGRAGAVVSLAVRMGSVVRLIDNIVLPPLMDVFPSPPLPTTNGANPSASENRGGTADAAATDAAAAGAWRRQQ